jgi:hypothetical protein
MVQVLCEVTEGMRDTERTVAIQDIHGRKHFLRVEQDFIGYEGEDAYLPIGVVGIDDRKQLVLIELPHESDSGANRLWVRMDQTEGITEVAS